MKNWCSQCGTPLIFMVDVPTDACGPTHAAMAAELSEYYKNRVFLHAIFAQRCPICGALVLDDDSHDAWDWKKHQRWHEENTCKR